MMVFKNLFRTIKLGIILSKYQILSYPGDLPVKGKLMGLLKFGSFLLKPVKYFTKPEKAIGERLALALKDMGPIYIKLGQMLSVRPDIIGKDVADQLSGLQDKLPPFEFSKVREILEADLGAELENMFASIEQESVAAASIAQVHKATTTDGKEVAVKVLRPNIYHIYSRDINLLYFIAKILKLLIPTYSQFKPTEFVGFFDESMKYELDLTFEAAAADELRNNNDYEYLYIPNIYWNLTTERVLVSEWIEGISIYDDKKIEEYKLDKKLILERIATLFFNQAYRDGFFHADLHPGNIFVDRTGKILLIDFGIVGRLEDQDRLAMAEVLYGFLKRDYLNIAKLHVKVGYLPQDADIHKFAQACRAIGEPIIDLPSQQISIGNLLHKLFNVAEKFNMNIQPQLFLLQKSLVIVEGIGNKLDPEINMWQLASPWINKWAAKNISPEAKALRGIKNIVNNLVEQYS